MHIQDCDESVLPLVTEYVRRLNLPTTDLMLTTNRLTYAKWLNRRISPSYGGAYCYLIRQRKHAVFLNLQRINLALPKSLEIVVAEELIHMRDQLDGDTRRHAHHGHDRIAVRVAEMTGVTMEDVRSTLLPTQRRPFKYVYQCPSCLRKVPRRKQGVWSCGLCGRGFDRRYVLKMVEVVDQSSPGFDG